MFNIPLYKYKIDNWQEKKQKLLEICSTIDFKNQDIGNRKITCINSDNVYTDYRSGNDNIYREDVKKILENELHNFKKDAKLDIMNVGEVWFQQYYKTQFHSPHNHGSLGWAGILYLDLPKDSPGTSYLQPWNDIQNDTSIYHPVKVVEGQIVVVPQFVTHFSPPNKSTKKKRIISWDMNLIPNNA